uniref:Reverse transcriptase domain-containing protein n=1 Tax=Poecilia mexicana TaxID=48701 RepID=A0A3B3YM34_9TELE
MYYCNDTDKYRRLLLLKSEYNELTTSKIATNLLWLKQSYYDQGEKAGKLLAWRLKKLQTNRAINLIKLNNGENLVDPISINDAFAKYYQNLYTSQYPDNTNKQKHFLDQLQFPTLSEESRKNLDEKLSVEELKMALSHMNSGKAPGPDGLPIELYKKFPDKLLPPLLEAFNESYEKGTLPPSLRLATISLLLKPGKPPTEMGSYRPISLMSCDTKILCKALARRIETHIPNLISNDQNGFVIGRQAFHNTRRLLNILYAKQFAMDHAFLSLDAEKAFDRIEWSYLFDTLKRFGLGGKYLKWIQLLYTEPVAKVATNGQLSRCINLCRSTRQGCPLSPLLFLFAIEPLAMAIRKSPEITGIQVGDVEHRLSRFADGIVLVLANLEESVQGVDKILKEFGEFSGYKVNQKKSSLLMLNRNNPPIQTQFTCTDEGFTYMGIKIDRDIEKMVSINYDPLVQKILVSLERWSEMPISMIGRINIIKMSILPKFLYLFQSIPLHIPASFFSSLDKAFNKFIWNNKRSRLRLSLLYLPYDRGGLRVPNIKLYYCAAQLCAASCYFSTGDIPCWVQIENNSVTLPLTSYFYSAELKYLLKNTKNPFLKNTISVWHYSHTVLDEVSKISCLSPIWGNNRFKPGRTDRGFRIWMNKGLNKIGDLYSEGVLMSFEQLVNKYSLPQKHFFKYLQIRSFIFASLKSTTEPPLSTIENIAVHHNQSRGLLSKFYNILLLASKENSLSYLQAWKTDLQTEIPEDEWNNSCLLAQMQTINTRFRLLQYKWLFRTYITPVKLHHFNSNIPDICVKCNIDKGTLFHCMWQCVELQTFWKEVIMFISRLIEQDVPMDSKLCLLHIFPDGFKGPTKRQKLVTFCLLQAKHLIALKWRNTERPKINEWIKLLSNNLAMEKLTYLTKGKLEDFKDIWFPFLHLVKYCDM